MFRSPSTAGLPHIQTMLDDLSFATPKQICAHLGIKESTLATYRRRGGAPRSIMLALFWETRWGRSAADTEAANWGAMYYKEAMMSKREIERMAATVSRLEEELARDCGQRPANLPIFNTR